ncbi:MAG: hypothetical protein A2Y02_01390 [Omnitrophica bacterium GWA2_52_12]|nr:MAG: hypothetical protein A2Y02_01390 [Omnitrophica bacterium GWA2_52_12]
MKRKWFAFGVLWVLWPCVQGPLWAEVDTKSVHVSFAVRPVFIVKTVSSSSGIPIVDFGWVVPSKDSSQTEILDVSVATNTVRPYKIYQTAKMIRSADGIALAGESMRFMASPGREGGRSEAPSYEEFKPGKRLIFSSRPGGGADDFQIFYLLGGAAVLDAGDYYGSMEIDGELS